MNKISEWNVLCCWESNPAVVGFSLLWRLALERREHATESRMKEQFRIPNKKKRETHNETKNLMNDTKHYSTHARLVYYIRMLCEYMESIRSVLLWISVVSLAEHMHQRIAKHAEWFSSSVRVQSYTHTHTPHARLARTRQCNGNIILIKWNTMHDDDTRQTFYSCVSSISALFCVTVGSVVMFFFSSSSVVSLFYASFVFLCLFR